MVQAKRIGIEIYEDLKIEFQTKLDKLNITMREATEALWFFLIHELTNEQALSLVNKYRIAMARREIEMKEAELAYYEKREKRAQIQAEGKEALAFIIGKGWLSQTMSKDLEDVNAVFALKKRIFDAGEITEQEFEDFTERYIAYLKSKNNPSYSSREEIHQAYKNFGFDDELIETYLIPEDKFLT